MIPDRLERLCEKNKLAIGAFGLGVVMIGTGVLWLKISQDKNETVQILSAQDEVIPGDNQMESVVVDVSGAVKTPGVYTLASGSRIQQALDKAGGLKDNADTEWVNKFLNRSQKLTDGQKIYIPIVREAGITETGNAVSASDLININTASAAELDKLPGIGEVTAGKIISGRPYSVTSDLVDHKVVSSKVWEEIKTLISAW